MPLIGITNMTQNRDDFILEYEKLCRKHGLQIKANKPVLPGGSVYLSLSQLNKTDSISYIQRGSKSKHFLKEV